MAKRRKEKSKQIKRALPPGRKLTTEPTPVQVKFMKLVGLLDYGDAIADAIMRKVEEIGRGRPAYLWSEDDRTLIGFLIDALNNVRDCQKHLAAGVNTKGLRA